MLYKKQVIAAFLSACSIYFGSAYSSGAGNFFDDVIKGVTAAQDKQRSASSDYKKIAFFQAVNLQYQKELVNKRVRTSAIYKRLVQNPRSGPGVEGFVNVLLCDVKSKSTCDDLFLVSMSDFALFDALNEDVKIEIFGTLQPKSGYFGCHFYITSFKRQGQ